MRVCVCICVCVYVCICVSERERDDISPSRKDYVYIKNVQDMQPEVKPSRVPPTQQAPDFPASQLNGCFKGLGGCGGCRGFGTLGSSWGTGLRAGSPGWGTFGGA